jgi:poly-gamma-glutamate synthesis protein (capsule biosynthesis protein)
VESLKKQIKVFMISLILVLTVGTAVMVGAIFMINRNGDDRIAHRTENETEIVDFGAINGINTDDADENESVSVPTYEEESEAISDDERLYSEALDKGENVRLVECADDETVTFAFAGDVLLDDNYAMMYKYTSLGSDVSKVFSQSLIDMMRGADVFMLNSEFPFSTRGEPIADKQFTFRAKPSNVEIYSQLGVDIVSLANNHAYDYGEDALIDTFTTLEDAGIPFVGAGRNIDEAKKPVYFVANGMKIAVVSATQIERNSIPDTKEATETNAGVLRCMDETKLLEVIEEAKTESDFVILYIHWGTENEEETDWLQDKQAVIYAEAGVDIIIGDHPHCLQKIDSVSGVPVIYSLGNYWFNSKAVDTCLVEVGINKSGMEYFRFVPCRQEDCRTVLLEGGEKSRVIEYMRSLSPNVVIDDDGYVTF